MVEDKSKITFDLPKDLDDRFRKAVADAKGLHKGVISEALEEAIEGWIMDQAAKKKESKTK